MQDLTLQQNSMYLKLAPLNYIESSIQVAFHSKSTHMTLNNKIITAQTLA